MNDCIFCKIIQGDIPAHKVYEDEDVVAFLDISPVSKGHTLIIPKEHAENLTEASHESAKALMGAVHHIAPKIMKALDASGYNLGMNHGKDAGQVVWHTHMHIMPRYAGQKRSFEKMQVSNEDLKIIAERIRNAL